MKIYNYDALTGLYIGESLADPSPLERGKFLIPRFATEIEPPAEIQAGSAAFWRGESWQVEPVPVIDENRDGEQDAPAGFGASERPGYFSRLVRAVMGK